jgi:hypothetical protein
MGVTLAHLKSPRFSPAFSNSGIKSLGGLSPDLEVMVLAAYSDPGPVYDHIYLYSAYGSGPKSINYRSLGPTQRCLTCSTPYETPPPSAVPSNVRVASPCRNHRFDTRIAFISIWGKYPCGGP